MISNKHGDVNFDDRLRLSILSGDNEEAQRILEGMDCCSMIDSSGQTLLHLAAELKNGIITKYLLEKGCKVDAVDNNGNTPLILACQHGNTPLIHAFQQDYSEIIKVIVKAKASVLITNHEGKNAAEIALGGTELNVRIMDPILERVKEECSNDSLRIAKEFHRIGCSLTRAVRLKDVAITKYMLDNGCNVNDQDHGVRGWTPLHQALVLRDNVNAKLLIDRGADVNVEDDNGVTPVNYAGYFDILEIMLSKGARLVDDNGFLIADYLFRAWGKEVLEMLISRYNLTDLSIRDREGTTLFYHLASNEAFDPVEILQKHFKNSIDIDQKDSRGLTALLMAVRVGNVGTVEFLLKNGAKLDASENQGREMFFVIMRNFRKENRKDREKILILLLQYGADVQWTSRGYAGNELFTLNFVLPQKHFAMAKIILARLALVEDLGVEIKDLYRNGIENNAMCKKYSDFCKRTIGKLKKTVIKRQVTLFDFMTCSEETFVKLARSEEFVTTVQSTVYRKRHSNLYYYKILRLRVKKAVEIVNLRKDLFCDVNFLIPELQRNQIVIEKIVEYIVYDMLRLMARQPTFKCTIEDK